MAVVINGTSGISGTNGSAGTPAVQGEDTNTGIFFPAADTVAVATAGAERVRVDSSGNVGVGTSSPSYALSVARNTSSELAIQAVNSGAGNTGIRLQNSLRHWSLFVNDGDSGALRFYDYTAAAERARIDSSGYLLAGVTSHINGHTFKSSDGAATYRPTSTATFGVHHFYSDFGSTQSLRAYFAANGGLHNYSANNVNLSDERVKTDILPVGSYWDKVKALQVVTYKYRDQSDGEDNIGVIAQQVESVAPEFVSNNGFGETPADGVPLKSIYETDLHYATLKALQEAMARIEELTARVAQLEAQ